MTEQSFMLYSLGLDFDDDNGRQGRRKVFSDNYDGDYVYWPVQH